MHVTKGTKWLKSVKFLLDPSCDYCKEAIKEIEEYFESIKGRKKYASSFLDGDKEQIKHVILRPDFNSSGYLTHWHVEMEGY